MRILTTESQILRSCKLVSNEIGLFKNIGKATLFNSDPKIIGYTSFNCDTVQLGAESYAGKSGGCGFDWESSFLASIGEGVERYSPAFYDRGKFIKQSFIDFAEGKAIHPNEFALFHKNQYNKPDFPFEVFNEKTKLYWDKVIDLVSKKEVYIPAVFIYMPFKADGVNISEQISTGFASHSCYYKALLNATYEVIERDAFMIAWMNLLPLPKIKIEGELKKFINKILPKHFKIHLFDMTTDIHVPSVFGILEGKHDFGNFISFSAATRFTLNEAVKKTILELCQSVPYFRYLLVEYKEREFDDFNEINSFEEHSLLYSKKPDLCGVFDTWLNKSPDRSIDFNEKDLFTDIEKIRFIKNQLGEVGYSYLVSDVSTKDVFKAGFKVVRVVLPELIHLNGTYGSYYLGGNRLYDVPKKMGYKKKKYEELNHEPHPFP